MRPWEGRRFKMGVLIALAASWGGLSEAVWAADHYVRLDWTNPVPPYTSWETAASNDIQAAVSEAAKTLGTVWVGDGRYDLTNQIVITNAITLRGLNGYSNAVINGNWPDYTNRCILITNNAAATLWGLTISNGYANESSGGGVYLSGPATVRQCRIVNNRAYYPVDPGIAANAGGGGVYMLGGPRLLESIVRDNRTVYGSNTDHRIFGGGIYLAAGGLISNCLIEGNANALERPSIRGGGGVYMAGSGLIVGSTFIGNQDRRSGSGAFLYHTGAIISNSSFVGNSYPGASRDSAVELGAGGQLVNCLIVSNAQGVYFSGGNSAAIMRNCTVADHSSRGIFIVNTNNAASFVDNNIVFDNSPDLDLSGGPSFTNFFNNCSGQAALLAYGAGNMTNAPQFADAGNGNYRLAPTSPCINAGTNRAGMEGAADLDGNSRIDRHYGRVVDIGAYEYVPRGGLFLAR